MATGTGLDAQLGFAPEVTWGTAVTPTKFVEFNSESLSFEPTFLEPTGLRVGTKYKRANRVRQSRKSVSGDVECEFATKGMGLLVKHMLGSALTTPTVIVAGAYKQIHTPGDFRGLGLTMQVGRPEPSSGTVRPFTYAGCKFPSWEFSIQDNAVPTLKLSVLGRTESTVTALATAAFVSGATVFDFSQATLKLGGTVATTTGVTSVTGGTAASTIITEISLKGEAPMADERFGLGNAGLRAEPLENDVPTITGSLSAEFNKAELYDVFSDNGTTAMQLTLTGGAIGATASNYMLDFILPAVKFKSAAPGVSGPDIVQMSTDFEVYSDETNPVIQLTIQSDEATL